jgi:hypothetical protein
MGAITQNLYHPETQTRHEAILARLLERLEFMCQFGDTAWATSVLFFLNETINEFPTD